MLRASGGREVEFSVHETAEEAAQACARVLATAAGNVVLTGGSTPRRAYEVAAERRRDWTGVTLWWGDERCVPPDHEWSNYGMAKRALLDKLERQPSGVCRIEGELGADEAAARYDRSLRAVALDLVLLGLGADGHAASLFPDAPGLDERVRLAIPTEAKLEPYVDRVSMTIPALEAAPLMVWLVAGEEKATAARRAFAEPPTPAVPASLLRSRDGRTLAFLDREAASQL